MTDTERMVATLVEPFLDGLIEAARKSWPSVVVDRRAFAEYIAARISSDVPVAEALAALDASALWLTCACAANDSAAIQAFETTYVPVLRRAVARVCADPSVIDDVLQRVREILLVRDGTRGPRISEYAGRGPFARWLKVIATREAIHATRKRSKLAGAGDDELASLAVPGGDPEIEHLKREYGAAFHDAVREAMASLPDETRAELRWYYVEGLGVEAIGAILRVAPSTVSRRLARARDELAAETRRALAARLGANAQEIESILRLIESRLELSRRAI